MKHLTILILLFSHISVVFCQQDFSLVVFDMVSGRRLDEQNAQVRMVPASTLKLLTCYMGYKKLGPDYRFTTSLLSSGSIENGELEGDLLIKGGGDPTLGSRRSLDSAGEAFLEWLEQCLTSNGISCVKGKLIVDASEWGSHTIPPTWPWYDLGNYYACGAWSINYEDNLTQLQFQLASSSQDPELLDHDPTAQVDYINELSTGARGSGDQAYIFGGPFQNTRHIRGTLPPGPGRFSIKGSIPNPPLFFAHSVTEYLDLKGIQTGEIEIRFEPGMDDGFRLVDRFRSVTLDQIIRVALKESDNLYCEAIMRTVAGTDDYDSALDAWQRALQEMEGSTVLIYDGAGLSPFNRLSADDFVKVIQKINRDDPEFWTLVPHVRESNLKKYLSLRDGRVKSGYMENVRTYVGCLSDRIGFVALYNGPDYKSGELKKKMAQRLTQALSN